MRDGSWLALLVSSTLCALVDNRASDFIWCMGDSTPNVKSNDHPPFVARCGPETAGITPLAHNSLTPFPFTGNIA